ncbi:MAG: hypothetical protein AAGM22_16495 [Acidobacteriota bacterium]
MSRRPNHRAPAPSHRPLALFLLLIAVLISTAVAHSQTLPLSNGRAPITALEIGDDLLVLLPHALPAVPLELRLLDEAQQTVASVFPVAVPLDRSIPVPLWIRSGVVGCDSPNQQSPLNFRFRDFQEATAHLKNRTFTVELRTELGQIYGTASVPFATDPADDGQLYFSDASGCPRFVFEETEPVYLSGYRADYRDGIALFLVDPDNDTTASREILEVRPFHQTTPHLIFGTLVSDSWTHLAWPAATSVPGHYGAIVGSALNRNDFSLRSEDRGVGALDDLTADGRTVHGMTIQEEECPDCDPFWDQF